MVAYLLIYFNCYYYCVDIITIIIVQLKKLRYKFFYIILIIKFVMNKFKNIKKLVKMGTDWPFFMEHVSAG